MAWFPSIVFGDAELAIDPVLLLREEEQLDHEHDQRTLRGHVEAERETEHRDDDLVERDHEHMDDVAEDEPDREMREHQVGRPLPMGRIVVASHSHPPQSSQSVAWTWLLFSREDGSSSVGDGFPPLFCRRRVSPTWSLAVRIVGAIRLSSYD